MSPVDQPIVGFRWKGGGGGRVCRIQELQEHQLITQKNRCVHISLTYTHDYSLFAPQNLANPFTCTTPYIQDLQSSEEKLKSIDNANAKS